MTRHDDLQTQSNTALWNQTAIVATLEDVVQVKFISWCVQSHTQIVNSLTGHHTLFTVPSAIDLHVHCLQVCTN